MYEIIRNMNQLILVKIDSTERISTQVIGK